MLSAAPPAFVVGLALQLSWILLWLVPFPGREHFHAYAFDQAWVLAGAVLVIAGVHQLRRRVRARRRMWLTIAMGALGLALLVKILLFVAFVRLRITLSPSVWAGLASVTEWGMTMLAVIGALALALAGGRRTRVSGVMIVVGTLVTQLPPPVQGLVTRALGPDAAGIGSLVVWLIVGALLVMVAGSIHASVGDPARPPAPSYDRAIRGLRALAIGLIVRGLVLAVTAFVLRGNSPVYMRIVIDGADLASALAAGGALFVIAQARLPALSPYLMQLAAGVALASVVVLTFPSRWIAEVIAAGAWWSTERFTTAIPIECELPMMIALVCLAIVLARRCAARLPVGAGGVVFIAAVLGAITAHTREPIWFACLAIATVAFVPAIWALRRQLVAEPVKTAADVFA